MSDPRLKRMAYRSWHRGCKETDLILGAFADRSLATLPPELLDAYERLLDENDTDIWAWLTGKAEAPEEYREMVAMLKKDSTKCPVPSAE